MTLDRGLLAEIRAAQGGAEFDKLAEAAWSPTQGSLSRLFVERFGDEHRFLIGEGTWCRFDGRRWQREATESARGSLAEIVGDLYNAAALERSEDARKRLGAFASRADNASFQAGALTLAEPALAVQVADLDAAPHLLNLANGTLDLDSGGLRPHRAADLLSRLAGGRFDPEAGCPLWESCLETWLASDRSLIAFARRLVGYLLLADLSEQLLIILIGLGANGKSVFLRILQLLLGEYSTTIALDSLLESPRGRDGAHHSDDLAALAGRRAAFAVESMRGRRLDASRVKALTGGDTISARRIFGRTFTFQNTARLVLATNHLPRIDGDDPALVRRLAVIPFDVVIPEAERDLDLARKLAEEVESGGLLNWALAGLDDWRERGLAPPDPVRERSATYARAEDPIGRFLEAEFQTRPGLTATRRELADRWNAYRATEGLHPAPARQLYDALRERGFDEFKTKTERGFHGIGCDQGGEP